MEHVETDSVWRVIEGNHDVLDPEYRIRYPDHHRNLMPWCLATLATFPL